MCDFGKKIHNLGENSVIFCEIGKVYLLNLDFSTNWECFRSIGNFFQPIGKKFGTGNRTQFCIEKKPWMTHVHLFRSLCE